ncbi:MAG: PH domain-containing protein [Phycisphaera sp.]|nr:PH domain-containing protein [Phycisphaera sp.]
MIAPREIATPDKPLHLRRTGATWQADSPEDALEPIDPALAPAAAALPADLIQGDEAIILLIKPSPWYILLGSLNTLILIGVLCGVGLLINGRYGLAEYSTDGMVSLAAALALVRLFWQAFEWFSRTYVLTDRRIIRIKGVLQIEIFQAQLTELERPALLYSVRERLFGLGTISFTTHRAVFPSAYWLMVRRPNQTHRVILETMQRYGR